jgi:hypothetical protein
MKHKGPVDNGELGESNKLKLRVPSKVAIIYKRAIVQLHL